MKPPMAKGKRIECPDFYGRTATYAAETVRFRPAAYGILRHREQILLSHSRFTGLWDFPGGGVEPFELLGEGMAREYFEETGLKVVPGDLVHVAEGYIAMFGHPFHSLRFYFQCRLVSEEPNGIKHDPGEVSELRWWDLDQMPRETMHVSDLEALERFLQHGA